MKKIILTGSSLLVLVFSGCVDQFAQPAKPKNTLPKWLDNPYIQNDKIAAVGCSKPHFKGVEAQKDLAISRAIDRIAKQNRISVQNVTLRKKTTNGIMSKSSSKSTSLQTVNKVSVSTKIKDIYKKENGDICVWVIQK
jgi:hypothetical protein